MTTAVQQVANIDPTAAFAGDSTLNVLAWWSACVQGMDFFGHLIRDSPLSTVLADTTKCTLNLRDNDLCDINSCSGPVLVPCCQ